MTIREVDVALALNMASLGRLQEERVFRIRKKHEAGNRREASDDSVEVNSFGRWSGHYRAWRPRQPSLIA